MGADLFIVRIVFIQLVELSQALQLVLLLTKPGVINGQLVHPGLKFVVFCTDLFQCIKVI